MRCEHHELLLLPLRLWLLFELVEVWGDNFPPFPSSHHTSPPITPLPTTSPLPCSSSSSSGSSSSSS